MTRLSGDRARGAAAIEFAIILPLFLVLLLGLIEWGYYFFIDLNAQNAAREGAREAAMYGATSCADGTASTAVSHASGTSGAAYLHLAGVGVQGYSSITASCNTTPTNPTFQVNVQVDFPMITGYMRGLMPSSTSGAGFTKTTAAAYMR